MICGSSIITASKEQVSSDLAGEVIILGLKSGSYFGLDGVGALIWSLIQKPISVQDIRDAILKNYDVEAERCEEDLMALLEEMAKAELIEVEDGAVR